MVTKVAFLNGVKNSGITYLSYIKKILQKAPKNWEKTVFQWDQTRITREESSNFLKKPVFRLVDPYQLLNFDIVISNEAYIGRFLKKPRTIYIDHGNSPMPCTSNTYFAGWTAFWDFIITPSRSAIKLTGEGISYYRKKRLTGSIKQQEFTTRNSKLSFSNDLKRTTLCQIPPLRKITKYNVNNIPKLKNNINIGFLPTLCDAVHPELSIYSYLDKLIEPILSEFPKSIVFFRPYPDDLNHPNISSVENYLNKFSNVVFEKKDEGSNNFFNKCDVLISDASTGGISFLLDRCIPPIYWKPVDTKSHSIPTNSFYEMLKNKIFIAENTEQLIKYIHECKNLTSNQRLGYFNRYCNDELKIENDICSILETLDIQSKFNINKYPNIDSCGLLKLS